MVFKGLALRNIEIISVFVRALSGIFFLFLFIGCSFKADLALLDPSKLLESAISITSPAAETSHQAGLVLVGTCKAGLPVSIGGAGLESSVLQECEDGRFSRSIVLSQGDGIKNISVSQTDEQGSTFSVSRDFIKDTIQPSLSITSPSSNALVRTSTVISGSCESDFNVNFSGDGLQSSTSTTCSSGSFSQSIVFTSGDGAKNIVVSQTDAAGNSTSVNRDFIKDATPPALSFSSPAANTSSQTGVTVSGSCEGDLDIVISGVGVSSNQTVSCSSGSFNQAVTFSIGDGVKNIVISQTDEAGNVASVDRNFIKDTTAPTLSILTPAANTSGQNGVTITGSCESGLSVELSGTGLASPSTTTCNSGSFSQAIVFANGDGAKNIIVSQTDLVGNVATINRDFIKDTNPPALAFTGPDANTEAQNGVTLTGNCETGLTINLSGSGLASPNTTSCNSGTFSQAILFTSGDGAKNIIASQMDLAGNSSSINRDFIKDTSPPSASLAGVPSNPSSGTALNITVSGAGVVEYKYKIGSSLTMLCSLAGDYSSAATVGNSVTDSLSMNFDYFMRICVIGKDAAGNWQLAADATVYDWVKDTNPPFAELAGLPNETSSVQNLAVTVKGFGVVGYKYKVGESSATDCAVNTDYSAEAVVADLITKDISALPDGELKLCVIGRDNANNYQELSQATEYTWTKSLLPPLGLSYPELSYQFIVNRKISPIRPSLTSGSGPFLYEVSPTLPAGLSMAPSSGVISGIPTTTSAVQTYTVTVTNAGGTTNVNLDLAVIVDGFTVADPAEGAAVSGYHVFSGTCTSGQTVKIEGINPKLNINIPNSTQVCQSGVYSLGVNLDGKLGKTLSFKVTQGNKSIFRNVVFAPSGFALSNGMNGTVGRGMALDSITGKIYVSGTFTHANQSGRVNLVRFNSDGTVDSSFMTGSGFNSSIGGLAVDGNGKLLVVGNFTSFNGTSVNRIVRLNIDGSIDETFITGTGFNSSINALLVDGSGKILVGGGFTSYNGASINRVARLNSDGSLDSTFFVGIGFNAPVQVFALDGAGNILVGGSFTSYNGASANRVARINTDGSLDNSFASSTEINNVVLTIAVDSIGKILVGGTFNYRIARLNTDGSLDGTFDKGAGFSSNVMAMAIDAGGKIVVGGGFTSYNGTTVNRLARLNSDGSLDSTFVIGSGFNSTVNSLKVDSSNRIFVGGLFSSYNSTTVNQIARLTSTGSLDSSLTNGAGFDNFLEEILLDSNGKLLVGGSFISYKSKMANRIARINSDGSLDNTFIIGSGFNSGVSALAQNGSGKILVGGNFSSFNGVTANRAARLNGDGSLDSTFVTGEGFDSYVNTVAVDSNGKALFGGGFTSYKGIAINKIARLNSDGSLDNTFSVGSGFNSTVETLAPDNDGKILVGGQFTSYNNATINRIARLKNDGSLDNTFVVGTGFDGTVYALAIDSNGKILVGGNFTSYGGTTVNRIVRLNSDGSLDNTFVIGTGFNSDVETIVSNSAGQIYVGGEFTSYNGTPVVRVARLHSNGILDNTFATGTGFGSKVKSLALDGAGRLIVGGLFKNYNNSVVNYLSYLSPSGTLVNNEMTLIASALNLPLNGTTTVTAFNGTPPYIYSVAAGAGSVNINTGVFTAAATPGSATIEVQDAFGLKAYTQISFSDNALELHPQTYTLAVNNSLKLIASKGFPPYQFTVVSGKGSITNSGIYTSPSEPEDAVIQVEDTMGNVATANLSIATKLAISPTLQTIAVGESVTFTATGGKSPYTYSLLSGAGSVSSVTGVYTSGGFFGTSLIRVTDSAGYTADAVVTTKGAANSLAINPTSIVLSANSRFIFSGIGGTGPYNYSLVSGVGAISVDGIYNAGAIAGSAVVRITDSALATATASVTVSPVLNLSSPSPDLAIGSSLTLVASGGVPPYSFSMIRGGGNVGAITGILTSPTQLGQVEVGVIDSVGESKSIVINIVEPLRLAHSSRTIPRLSDYSIEPKGGSAPYAYTLQSGVGSLSGNIFRSSQEGSAVVRVTDAVGQFVNLNISVVGIVPNVTYANVASTYFLNESSVNLIPTVFGDAPTSYSITPSLPAGLALNTTTGVITGVPTQTTSLTSYAVISTNTGGSSIYLLSFAIVASSSFTLDDPLEAQNISGHYIFNGSCVGTSIISISSVSSNVTIPLQQTTCTSGKYLLAVNINGAVNTAKDFIVSSGNKSISRQVVYNPSGFALGYGFNSNVRKIELDGGSQKIYLGGSFTVAGDSQRNYLARLNGDGSLDSTFVQVGTGLNNIVNTMVLDSNSKLLVGGYFTAYNSTQVNRIARFNSDGTIDNTFVLGAGFNGYVSSLAIDGSGKILVGGLFSSFNSMSANRVARLLSDGSLDNTFVTGTGFDSEVTKLVVDDNGKIIVTGYFTSYNGTAVNQIVRLNSDGSLDNTFVVGTGFNSTINALAIDSNGKILVGGNFTSYGGTTVNRIVRLNNDGSLDGTFITGTAFNSYVSMLEVDSNDRIIVGGGFTTYNSIQAIGVARLNSDGSLDNTFSAGKGIGSEGTDFAIDGNGKILIGGYFTSYDGKTANYFVRVNSDGSLDSTFTSTGKGVAGILESLAIDSMGKTIIAGNFSVYDSSSLNYIARLNTDGSVDNTFTPTGTGFNSSINSLVLDSDSKILVGGLFNTYNGIQQGGLARLNSDGSLDNSFILGTGFNNTVNTIVIGNNGKIFVGGYFTLFDGISANRIVRLNSDGSLDNTFNVGTGFDGVVLTLAIDSTGKIVVGGEFTSYNGTPVGRIARLNSDGSLDNTFSQVGTGFNGNVYKLIIDDSDRILVGGGFTLLNGKAVKYLTRLNSDGSSDNIFGTGTGFNSVVKTLATDINGKILAGGYFTTYNDKTANRMARLNSDGTLDTSFVLGAGFNSTLNDLKIDSAGNILVGGIFSSFNQRMINNSLIRLSPYGSLLP